MYLWLRQICQRKKFSMDLKNSINSCQFNIKCLDILFSVKPEKKYKIHDSKTLKLYIHQIHIQQNLYESIRDYRFRLIYVKLKLKVSHLVLCILSTSFLFNAKISISLYLI